jgi:trigger factor
VSVEGEELGRFLDAAFRSLREEFALAGFRRGHVPEAIAREHLGEDRIFAEAVERAVGEKTREILEGLSEEIVGEPQIELTRAVTGKLLAFRIVVAVLPSVPIEDWRTLRIPSATKEVTEGDVDATLEELRRSRAAFRAVLRPARIGDLAEVDFTVRIDGVVVEGGVTKGYELILGEDQFLLPGFSDAIVGMTVGETKTIRLAFPPDWRNHAYAGKEGEFTITLRNLQERILPSLDDTFARSLGRFENLGALRESIKKGIAEEREIAERRRLCTEALDRLGERIAAELIPPILIEREVERMKAEFRSTIEENGMAFDDYLRRLGKREEELTEGFREGALRRVRAALVLRAIAKRERITVSKEEVEERTQAFLRQFRSVADAERSGIDPQELRLYTERALREEKVMDLLAEVLTNHGTTENSPVVAPRENNGEPSV